MKKILLIITCFSILLGTGACSIGDWRLVHRIDIQQGNVITQDMVNRLEPGMTRRQAQFVVGSPMVADVFHQDRWDYIYRYKPGKGKMEKEHVSLFFEDDRLVRVTGTLHPQPVGADAESERQQITLTVPPQERVEPGIINRLWHWITFRSLETEP